VASAGRTAWGLAFQCTPILLTRGITTNIPGGILPIIALTDAASLVTGLLSGGAAGNLKPDDFFAQYMPVPGATLLNQQVATYPMANQAIAANAVIAQPLSISMMMTCSARPGSLVAGALGAVAGSLIPGVPGGVGGGVLAGAGAVGGYAGKLAILTALQATLSQHNNQGGTYSIVTPSFVYTDCILTSMRDVSGGGTNQKQFMWQLDFIQPLVSIAAAQSALNSLMQKLQSGLPLSGPSQVLGAAGLPVGSSISPLTSILPPNVTGVPQ
jgi:hypothetical protein